jgi:hypothetical protein
MPILTTILCAAKTHYFGPDARRAREAIIEMASLGDAIRARELLMGAEIDEYEGCEPVFVGEPSAVRAEERAYCDCLGCQEYRAVKTVARDERSELMSM